MNERPITEAEASDIEMLRLISSRESKADQIMNIFNFAYEHCKAEHEAQEAKMATIGYDHEDYRVEKYMSGFFKGRYEILESLKTRIQ